MFPPRPSRQPSIARSRRPAVPYPGTGHGQARRRERPPCIRRHRRVRAACGVWGALLFLLAALLTGCGKGRLPADLVFANGAEVETLDPALITAQIDMRVAYALFEGLATFDRTGKPVPGVAATLGSFPGRHGLHVPPAPRRRVDQRPARHRARFRQRLAARAHPRDRLRICLPAPLPQERATLQRSRRAFHRFLAGRRPRARRRYAPGRTRTRHALFPRPVLPERAPARAAGDRATLRRRLDQARTPRFQRPVHARRMAHQRPHPPAKKHALLGPRRRAPEHRGRAAHQPVQRRA